MRPAVSLAIHLLVSFACAHALARSVVFAALRRFLLGRLERYFGDPDAVPSLRNILAGHLAIFVACPACQSFWFGAICSPLAGGALTDLVSAPLRPLVAGLAAYAFTVVVTDRVGVRIGRGR